MCIRKSRSGRRDPFERMLRQFIKKPALDVVAGLAMQHTGL